MKKLIYLLIIFTSTVGWSSDRDLYFQKFMNLFESNPSRAMNIIPPKFDQNGKIVTTVLDPSLERRLQEKELDQTKDVRLFSTAIRRSRIESFFAESSNLMRKVELMSGDLLKHNLVVGPWSGDYWPTYNGGIAARYEDPAYPNSIDFKENYEAYQSFLPINYKNQEALDDLSPAEKYDILVGDSSFSMTRWSFEDANKTYINNGNKIENWFGICHGWAPAAFMVDRPEKLFTVQIKNFQGNNLKLTFYPDDVKALTTLLWANASVKTYFLGGRCNIKNPRIDEHGRIIDEDCFDVNPGSWHMAIINQVGLQKRSLVIEASYDYEIWNQPISAYEVSYFNPITKEKVSNLSEAIVPVEDFAQDIFKTYRGSNTRFVVGVNMSLTYVK